jgi:AcrR family transcriptional regulator
MGRKELSDQRKPQILEFCHQVVAEVGFENTTIALVAEKMGVSKSLILHYFNSKEELFRALFDYMFQEKARADPADCKCSRGTISPGAAGKAGRRILELRLQEGYDDVVFYGSFYLATRDPQLRRQFQETYNRLNDTMVQAVTDYLASQGKPTGDAEKTGRLFGILLEGFDFLAAIDDYSGDMEKEASYMKKVFWTMVESL